MFWFTYQLWLDGERCLVVCVVEDSGLCWAHQGRVLWWLEVEGMSGVCVMHWPPVHRVYSQLNVPSYFHSEFSEVLGHVLWEHVICVFIKRVKWIVPWYPLGLFRFRMLWNYAWYCSWKVHMGRLVYGCWLVVFGKVLWKALALRDNEDGVECLPCYFGV